MVFMQGTSDPNPELLDAMAMCGHLVARDSVHWFLAEHRQRLFPDDMFADLFGSGRGRPSVPADVIATVMVRSLWQEGRSFGAPDSVDTDGPSMLQMCVFNWSPLINLHSCRRLLREPPPSALARRRSGGRSPRHGDVCVGLSQ